MLSTGSTQAFVPLFASQPGPALRSNPGAPAPAPAPAPASGSSLPGSLTAAGAAALLAAAGSVVATRNRRRGAIARAAAAADEFCYGLIGSESAWGSYQFDPLKLSEKYPEHLPWMREAELKHGRLAMLAWVGLVVPDVFGHLPGPEGWESCYGPDVSTVAAHNGCIGQHPFTGPLAQPFVFVGCLELSSSPPPGAFVRASRTLTRYSSEFLTTWAKMNFYGGGPGLTLENAGDYSFGKRFLPEDPEQAKQMRLKELKNGRLAMIAFGGAITQATLTGNGFPWLYAERASEPSVGFGASLPAMHRPGAASLARASAVARRAEGEGEGYKMSKAVPFLPMSPALEGYAGEEEGFDPMGFSLALDIRWLREAELKHARVAMLATVGWIVTDLGNHVPGPLYQCSTLEAHDLVLVKGGVGAHLLAWTGYFEFFSIIAFIQACEGKSDRAPGDFGLRMLYPKDEAGQRTMQLKELRNGRLAMLAFMGIAGVAEITGKTWPFFATANEKKSSQGSAFCGATLQGSVQHTSALQAMERSASVPFLPKPKGLDGMVGEETQFDPCCIAETYDIRWMREAELKHGRVCMLATLGFVVQQYYTLPGLTPQEDSLQAVYSAPQSVMAGILFLCGFIESSAYGGKITMLDMFKDTDREPGNFGLDGWLVGKDAEAVKTMKMKELKNGRLAMLAFGGMIHHNLVVSGPLFPTFPDGWEGPQGTWKAESIMDFLRTVNT